MAVSSFLFIALASITGIILSFEPVSDSMNPYAVSGLADISVAETVSAAQKRYDEVLGINVDNRFVTADVINRNGDSEKIYINPVTGEKLGNLKAPNEFFQTVTTLHRSLFLHGLGRFFIGLTCFLLLLIALTGSVLVVKRQRGFRRFFSRVVRDDLFSFYHVLFGRIWLLPIVIIAASGTLLSLEKFGIFPDSKISHNIDFDAISTEPRKPVSEFDAFNNIALSEVTSIEFPFSTDPEDAFTVTCHDREIAVNQITGDVLSEQRMPAIKNWLKLSLDLHTGRSNIVWAIVLAIGCLNILFFIYSGFAITLKRRSGKIRNPHQKEDAEYIVLVGSENGSTMRLAKSFHKSLLDAGAKSHLAELNSYCEYPAARHLIVLTATYGQGGPTANADKALARIEKIAQHREMTFSVVGFGSHAYPDFCRFAFEVYNSLSKQPHLSPLLEIKTINDKSALEFIGWTSEFSKKTGVPIHIETDKLLESPRKLKSFVVVSRTEAEIGAAFLIRLRPKNKKHFESGDLLNVYPTNDHRERQYSIGKIGGDIQLSVKRHESGLGSEYLHSLEVGQFIKAQTVSNREFHFPASAPMAILISNGTGIAPFLGMIDQNDAKIECHLYCGFKESGSFEPYRGLLERNVSKRKLSKINVAYSREGNKHYVKDLLYADWEFVSAALKNNAVIMICGSLSMQNNVLELLDEICTRHIGQPLSHFQSTGQIKMDCY